MSDQSKDISNVDVKRLNIENPEEKTAPQITKSKFVAGGIPAILSSAQHMLYSMGPVRAFKALNSLNKIDGYSCPGCAWPDPDDERSRLGEYCENGAKAIAEEATTKKITAKFFETNSVTDLSLLSDYEIGKKGRIAQPVYLAKGDTHYRSISWENAFRIIAENLHSCNNPDEAAFYTSGRTSNEAAFLYQLFVRQFGTNNLPDCSNMCHESSGIALTESLGFGKGSIKLEDFYEAEVIIILGQNPGTNHPRMLSALRKAKENGCIIISVNPLKETGLIAFNEPQSINGLLGIKKKLNFTNEDRIYGPRVFFDLVIKKGFSVRTDIEKMNTNVQSLNPLITEGSRIWVWSAFVGFKKQYQFVKRVKGNFQFLYNVYDDHDRSPYADKFNVRFGFEFPMRKGMKPNWIVNN